MSSDLIPFTPETELPKEFTIRVDNGAAIFLSDDHRERAREEWIATRNELLRRGYILFEYRDENARQDCALFKHESICTTSELKFRNAHPELYRPLVLKKS